MATYHYQQGDRPLDGYTIQYALGRGGFGEVYFAVSDSGREVALKAVQNFEEVELRGIGHCMNLKSPHLVMIFDVKHAPDGTPWVIMEYVNGPSLRDVLDEAPDGLEVEQATFFLKELAKGLSYLHEAGVVHRDLKPHNVFFEDGIVKIGDYSLSKVITASHRSGNTMTVGSVHYMAPEISLGRYDKTVDIYALGVILYEMLTGSPPYVGESLGEVLMKHLSSNPDVDGLPEPVASAVVKAMQRDPADRFQTAQEMVEAIAGKVTAAPLADSFNPATLSLVGERARAKKQAAYASAASDSTEQSVQENPLHENQNYENQDGLESDGRWNSLSTAPTVMEETTEYYEATRRARRKRHTTAMHRAYLFYAPPDRVHAVRDPVSQPLRLCMAAVATLLLMFIAKVLHAEHYPLPVFTMLGIATFFFSTVMAFFSFLTLPRDGSFGSVIVTRFAWAVPLGLCFPIFLGSRQFDDELVGPFLFCLLASTLVFDWRCLVAPHRSTRVSAIPVLLIGGFVVLVHTLLSRFESWTSVAGAMVMAAAIVTQLVAPMNAAAANAPLLDRRQRRKKTNTPPTLPDRLATLQKLVIGVAVMTLAGLVLNGDDDGPFILMGLIASLAGLSALRFRLQGGALKKAAGSSSHPATFDRSQDSDVEVDVQNAWKTPQLTITWDWMSFFLEALFVIAFVAAAALVMNGYLTLLPAAAIAVVACVLALRFWIRRRHETKRNRVTRSRLPLSYDVVSIALEIGVGVAAAAAAVGMFLSNHPQERVMIAVGSGFIALVLLRIRLGRRVTVE